MSEPVATPVAVWTLAAWLGAVSGWTVFGLPLGGVLFAMLMSLLNALDQMPGERRKGQLWNRTVLHALYGCLIAWVLIKLPFFSSYRFAEVGFSVMAPLATLGIPWFRIKAGVVADSVADIALRFIEKRFGGKSE